jgi:hypothetical protein
MEKSPEDTKKKNINEKKIKSIIKETKIKKKKITSSKKSLKN